MKYLVESLSNDFTVEPIVCDDIQIAESLKDETCDAIWNSRKSEILTCIDAYNFLEHLVTSICISSVEEHELIHT